MPPAVTPQLCGGVWERVTVCVCPWVARVRGTEREWCSILLFLPSPGRTAWLRSPWQQCPSCQQDRATLCAGCAWLGLAVSRARGEWAAPPVGPKLLSPLRKHLPGEDGKLRGTWPGRSGGCPSQQDGLMAGGACIALAEPRACGGPGPLRSVSTPAQPSSWGPLPADCGTGCSSTAWGQACLCSPELFLRPAGWAFQEPGKNRQGLTSCSAADVAGGGGVVRPAGKCWPGVTPRGPCPGWMGKRPLGLGFGFGSLCKEGRTPHLEEPLRASSARLRSGVGRVTCRVGAGEVGRVILGAGGPSAWADLSLAAAQADLGPD